jgi:iron complex outermembrane receptor protein
MGRISVVHEEFDGYTKNIFPGAKDGNFIDATAIRGQLLYDPGGASRASLLVQYGENEGENAFTNIAVRLDPATGLAVVNPGGADSAGYVDPTPGNLTDININQPGYLRTRQLTSILRLEHDFDAVKFVSISGFEASHKNMLLDTDAGPTFVRESMFTPRAEEWSQEVRLEHDGDKVDWVTGLYYFDYYVKGTQDLNGSSFVSASYRPMDYTVSTTSWAAFGNLNYALAPGLTTDLGVRFTNEKKQIGIYIPFTFVYTPAGASAGFGSFRYDESSVGDLAKHDSDNVSFNARLNWKPNEDTLIYGGVSRAFKGGAFNLGLFALPRTSEYKVKEEQLTSYEVGVHTDLGPVKLNGSAFYYDYKDYQAFLYDSATSSSRIFNTDASITGVELEAITHPFAGFDLSGSVTALDATLEGVSDKLGNKKDRKMALAPELSATLLARYSWAAPWGGEFSVQGDVVYRDSQYFDPLNSPALFEPSHTTADMRLAWANGQWKVALVGENITDEEYRNYVYDFSSNRYVQGMYARPSWFGVTLGYDFK